MVRRCTSAIAFLSTCFSLLFGSTLCKLIVVEAARLCRR